MGLGWCSERDSHVEWCLSSREQVKLGHLEKMGFFFPLLCGLVGVFDYVVAAWALLCCGTSFNKSATIIFCGVRKEKKKDEN